MCMAIINGKTCIELAPAQAAQQPKAFTYFGSWYVSERDYQEADHIQ